MPWPLIGQLIILISYGLVLERAHARWSWLGLAVALSLIVGAAVAVGTVQWVLARPPLEQSQTWRCSATWLLPPTLVGGLAAALALRLFGSSSPRRRAVAVVVAEVIAFAPGILLMLWWNIGIVSCDTL